jgi:signal transduction histidine kinase
LLRDVRSLTQERQIKIVTKIKEGLKDFEASEGYLLLAAKNILLNAIKHSPTGGEVQVLADVSPNRELGINQFCLTIIDRGEGISEKDLPYIFDPFYRVDTARNRVGGGSGIGLSLAMSLVKMHEGSVEVKSELGVGSTFKIIIPQGSIKAAVTEGQNFIPFTEGLLT